MSFMGAFVEGVWHLCLQCTFSKPIFLPFFLLIFLSCFKEQVEGHCPSPVSR
jgi:hypothetical protein